MPFLSRRSSRSQQRTFTHIYEANTWSDEESVSGPGSTLARGADFHDDLLALLDAFAVRSLLDAPCGDCNWIRRVLAARRLDYTGVDIVEPLIIRNAQLYTAAPVRFRCLDMTRADLPRADLVLCRDGLVHLSFADARAALRNFRRSGSRFLLTTTFADRTRNRDVRTGGWRVLNMQAAPFRLPAPLASIDERCRHSGGIYRDKRLGLWALETIEV
jgi:SAM-dependent methyltransferase